MDAAGRLAPSLSQRPERQQLLGQAAGVHGSTLSPWAVMAVIPVLDLPRPLPPPAGIEWIAA